ncbi:MAG: TolB family protein [Egibacteraceae bacterium]
MRRGRVWMWLGGAFSAALVCALVLPALSSGAPFPPEPTARRLNGLTLVTASAKGVKANGESTLPSLSADGTQVAFLSSATNLDPVDPDNLPDVYYKDLASGVVRLVTVRQDGAKANGESASPSLSADGTRVTFVSTSTNLDPADSDSLPDAYVKNLETGKLTLASIGNDGQKADAGSEHPALSADGSRVAFTSRARNLDPSDHDDVADVYVKDLETGKLTLASTSSAGRKADVDSISPALSGDGRTVVFATAATTLDSNDRPGVFDVYAKNLESGDVTLVSAAGGGIGPSDESREPAVSSDGKVVAFTAGAIPSNSDDTAIANVFTRNLATGRVTLVSAPGDGTKANGSSGDPTICANGTVVAFATSATNLAPDDHTGFRPDVIVKDLASGVFAATGGVAPGTPVMASGGPSGTPAVSEDGRTVAFVSSATSLAPTDTDRLADIYVVRWRSSCGS